MTPSPVMSASYNTRLASLRERSSRVREARAGQRQALSEAQQANDQDAVAALQTALAATDAESRVRLRPSERAAWPARGRLRRRAGRHIPGVA